MLDENGYRRKTYDEILEEMQSRARELFGEKINLTKSSPVGLFIMLMAWFLSLVWKDNEDVYHSAHPNQATCVNLDRLLPYSGITRNLAQFAEGEVTLTGTAGYTLEQGFQVTTPSDVFFETTHDITLDDQGEGTARVRALEVGRTGNISAGEINLVVNPDANIESVINSSPTSKGREKETDLEVRQRRDISIEGLGAATVPSIRARLLEMPDIRAATVIENYENETINGQPPHSIQAFVLGGDDQVIAETIFNTKAGGIRPYGQTTRQVMDESGQAHTVGFTRAVEVPIYSRITISKSSAFSSDGADRIRRTIVQFIGGEDNSGALYSGLNMGDDVIYSKLIAKVFQVEGIEDLTLELSKDNTTFMQSNIAVGPEEVAQTDVDYIEVTLNV
ncbi:baseplate J/gp47 family protein [Halobacillus sp. SY10]|uniref:baseplate J/gp47 family protein n=1 Tax=Halobacillus sp. SY10 TaxID=3381356 RepID=UPI003878FF64